MGNEVGDSNKDDENNAHPNYDTKKSNPKVLKNLSSKCYLTEVLSIPLAPFPMEDLCSACPPGINSPQKSPYTAAAL
jgi:hypothetical protein